MVVALIILVSLVVLYLIATVCRSGHTGWKQLEGYSYAHRGLHDDKIPENSMLAFAKAKEHGYGIELDLHLLSDGNLAVFHDGDLKRMTGQEGTIEALTTVQLSQYHLAQTEQTIPTFAQLLELIDGSVPLVVELKAVNGNHKELCQTVKNALKDYRGAFCIESFDPRCIAWLRKHWPEAVRGLLLQNYFKPKMPNLPFQAKLALVWQLMNISLYPDFIAYRFCDRNNVGNFIARKFWGAKGVVWTVKSQKDFDTATKEGYISIFEGFTP